MSQLKKQLDSTQDDLLADFADQVIEGRIQPTASTSDQDLLSLEKTILRLKETFPPVMLEDAMAKQMQVRLKARIKREDIDTRKSIWEGWFGQSQIIPQFGMAFAAIALLIIIVIISPTLTTVGSSATTATAFAPAQGLLGAAALVIVVILVLWKMRRK